MKMTRQEALAALGESEGATPAQIKRAWQAKCRLHHPDRGGDVEEMARFNRAYQTLTEPEATPLSPEEELEIAATKALSHIFEELFEHGQIIDILKEAENSTRKAQVDIRLTLKKLSIQLHRLEKYSKTFIHKGVGPSLIHDLLSVRQERTRAKVVELKQALRAGDRICEMLKEYERAEAEARDKDKDKDKDKNRTNTNRRFSFPQRLAGFGPNIYVGTFDDFLNDSGA